MNFWRRLWNRATGVMRPQVWPRTWLGGTQAGVRVDEDTAMTLAGWWAAVSVISRTIAALPWHVYERSPQGRKAVDGTVSWLLNTRPNPETTAFAFKEAIVAHALNWGNGYAEIERDMAGRVTALWLLTPDRVCPERDDSGALVYRVRSETTADVVLPASSVYHVHGLAFDGLIGYSPVRMAARSIGLGIAQDVFGQSFYANGTVLGSLIELPQTMNSTQIEEAEKYYNGKYGGPQNSFKTRVAPAGVKMHPMGMPLVDAQFIETRKLTVTECARWLGVPPHKLADLERSTNNNIEHQGIEFVTDAIVPWAMRMEQEADFKLIGARAQGRVYTKMSVNALMRGDAKSRAEFYKVMTQIGAMSVNQVCELEELNTIGEAGDSHLVQLNQTTLEWLVENPGGKAAAAPQPSPAPPPGQSVEEPPEPEDDPENVPLDNVRARALQWARQQQRSH